MNDIFFIVGFFGIVLIVFLWKALSIYEKSLQNRYKLEKKKLKLKKKTKNNDDEESDEYEDFIDSLPNWLRGIADGANVNLEAVYDGDPEELKKVRDLLDKNLPGGGGGSGGFL